MKKGWKIFWIIAGSLGGLGLVLCGAALVLGVSFYDIEEVYPYGIGFINDGTWGRRVEKRIINSSEDHDHSYADNSDYSFSDVMDMEMNVAGCDVIFEESKDQKIYVKTDKVDFGNSEIAITVEEEGGKLTIETVKNGKLWTKFTGSDNYYGTLYVYLPTDLIFDNADLSFGAGDLCVTRINAIRLNINVGAGDFDVEHFQADDITVNVGAGDIDMYGEFQNEFNLKCGVGKADITLTGGKYDYNYILKSGLGEVSIGEEEYGGLANTRTIDNGSNKEMDIICGAGSVSVEFGHDND